tara:strand:- start:2462 stop:3985 length:1524 start_codon:yes stop_codon:yes gene_type:complete
MKITIYDSEIKDGLEQAIASSASIAFATPVSMSKMSKSEEAIARDMAIDRLLSKAESNPDQFDLYYLDSVLVSTGWNKNDDVFGRTEIWGARKTPEDKPFNFMHDEKDIIGHITSSMVLDEERNAISEDTQPEDLPDRFDIITSAVLYNSWSDPELRGRMDKIISEIEEGKWYVSMECLFAGFDYALIDKTGNHKVLARDQGSAFLTKHLRAYGGSGEYEGYKIGRLLKSVAFSGKGLVSNPANPRSVIINDITPFEDTEEITITTSNFKENSNMSNELLEKQIEELKLDLATAKADSSSLKDEISNQKDEEIQAQIETFEATLAEKDQAVAEAKAAVEAAEAKLVELEEALSAKNIELVEAIAKVEAQEAEAKLLARKTALAETGATEEEAEAILASFSDATDEMFEQVVTLAKKGFVPFKKKDDEKEEDDKEADADTTSEVEAEVQQEETDEAEAEAEAEVLEEAEEEVEAALTDAGDDSVEELSTVASEWLESNVLRTTANLNK